MPYYDGMQDMIRTSPTLTASVLQPGRNCWRIERADRAAFLIDGDAYFKAFRAAVTAARHSILILSWDIDTRVKTSTGRAKLPSELGDLLRAVLAKRSRLQAYVLSWDYHPVYAMEREWLSMLKLTWGANRRLHVRLDSDHPAWASHHQKVVVVDDAVAFVGGLDPTRCRWDTPEHPASDPRRVDPDGHPYAPFHDVQMLVSGDVARALGELARERWHRATGERLAPPHPAGRTNSTHALSDPWPSHLVPDLTDVPVAIARTEPSHRGRPEVREVEHLFLDSIAAARRLLYIETQYLTCSVISAALVKRLKERDGPEIILIVHPNSTGWLEQRTMDVLRGRVIQALRRADTHGRLGMYYPHVPDLKDGCLTVHSKVFVADDEFLRVGSANLSNRSMGLDTECDLAVEANGEARVRKAIAAFRNRLLAEHLDVDAHTVAARIEASGSGLSALESLRGRPRTLHVFETPEPDEMETLLPDTELIDPDRPLQAEVVAEHLVPREHHRPARRRIVLSAALLVALVALAASWQWTPLKEWLDVQWLTHQAAAFQDNGFAPLVVLGGFVLGGLLVVPVTLMILVTGLAFGPFYGFLYTLLGMTASALVTYWLGRVLGRDTVRQLAGSRLNQLSRRLARRGLLTMVTVRIVPVAPFTVVNLVAGASHISFRDFFLGTVLGELPGVAGMSVFADQIGAAIRHPGPGTLAVLTAAGVVILLGALGLRRWLETKEGPH